MTHHADSWLMARLPADGEYCVQLTDAQARHGPEFAYRLRISEPRPDFEILVTPSSLRVEPGRWTTATAHVIRRDGFSGPIALGVGKGPGGVVLSGARIPANVDRITFTVGSERPIEGVCPLRIDAVGVINGTSAMRTAVAADEVEQAFLWRHLAPRQTLLLAGGAAGRGSALPRLKTDSPVALKPGSTASVVVVDDRLRLAANPRLILKEAPAGITLGPPRVRGDELTIEVSRAPAMSAAAGNLLIEASVESRLRRPGDGAPRSFTWLLPAIGCEPGR